MRLFVIAFQFLTIIPLPVKVRFEERDLGRSMALFPLVGLTLGGMLLLGDFLLSQFLPRPVTDLLLLVFLTIATGALHLDGLADVIDALAARGSRERFLEVMKDSSVGAVGAVGLMLAVLLKYQLLLNIGHDLKPAALLLFPALARFGQVLISTGAKKARENGLGGAFISGVGTPQLIAALATIMAAAYLCFSWQGAVILAAVSLLVFAVRAYFHRRLGGITGDIIGFSSELTEISSLLLILAWCGKIEEQLLL